MTGPRTPPCRPRSGGFFLDGGARERHARFAVRLDRRGAGPVLVRRRLQPARAPALGGDCRPTPRSMRRWCASSISSRRMRAQVQREQARCAEASQFGASLQAAASQLATMLGRDAPASAGPRGYRGAGDGAARHARGLAAHWYPDAVGHASRPMARLSFGGLAGLGRAAGGRAAADGFRAAAPRRAGRRTGRSAQRMSKSTTAMRRVPKGPGRPHAWRQRRLRWRSCRPCWPARVPDPCTRTAWRRWARRCRCWLPPGRACTPRRPMRRSLAIRLSRPAPLEPQAAPAAEASAIAWPEPSAAPRSRATSSIWRWCSTTGHPQFPALLVAWIMQLRRRRPCGDSRAISNFRHQIAQNFQIFPRLASPMSAAAVAAAAAASRTALAAIRSGVSGSVAFEAVEPALRPGVQALGFQVLRWLGRAEALRRQLAKRTPPPAADALLCTALALAWDADVSPYEPFTLVDQAVEAAKRNPGTRAQASFINACLRRFLRERDELVAATDREPVAQWNHPRWWIERLQARPSARLAARARRRQHPGADDAARQSRQDRRGVVPARAGSGRACGRCRSAPAACSWSRARPGAGAAGLRRGQVLGAGCGGATRGAAAARRPASAAPGPRRCACSTPAPRRAARPRICSKSPAPGARADRAGNRRRAQPPHRRNAGAPRPARREVRRGRRRAARRVVGWPALRRHPARCALHRLGHRAPPPRRALAAPRKRHRAAGAPAGHAAGVLVAAGARAAAGCCTAPVPFSAKRARTRSMRFLRTTPTRVCCPRPAICCRKARRMAAASRTMPWVTTTVSSTPCSKKVPHAERRGAAVRRGAAGRCRACLLPAWPASAALAQAQRRIGQPRCGSSRPTTASI